MATCLGCWSLSGSDVWALLTSTGRLLRRFSGGHTYAVSSVHVAGDVLVTGSFDRTAIAWDFQAHMVLFLHFRKLPKTWLVVWLVCWLAGWLAGWLFSWLVGWLGGWLE